jgi:drug/metabolite transporter (DMT)-like permease
MRETAFKHPVQYMTGQDWFLLIVLSVVWGGSFFFAKVAVAEIPPLSIVFLRVALAALALHLVQGMLGLAWPRQWRFWRDIAIMGLLNNAIPFSLIFWGQQEIASGLASILNAATPLFTVLVAHVLTDNEKAGAGKLVGVLIGLAGVAFMMGRDVLGGLGVHVWSELAVLGAALSYAFAGIFGRRFKGIPPLAVAGGQLSASSLLMALPMFVIDRPWSLPQPSLASWAAIGGLALISTALAYVIFFRILASAGATNLLLVTFLIPVSALTLGALFLGEALAPHHFLGMAAIGIGLALIDGRLFARLRAG